MDGAESRESTERSRKWKIHGAVPHHKAADRPEQQASSAAKNKDGELLKNKEARLVR